MLLFFAAPGPEPGLEALLTQVAQGERTALGELYRRTKGAVYALALSYLRTHSDAEDITQNTFLRVWEQAGQFSGQGKALSWILAVTRNLSRMELRRRQQQRQLPLGEEHLELPAPEGPVSPEDRQLLQSLLERLEPQERQIVVLHAVAGLKHREIAALLELPLSTVLSKYSRSLKRLKKSLEGEEAL